MQCMMDAMRSIVSLLSHATVALAGSLAVAGCSLSPQPDHDTAATTPERLEAHIHKVHRFLWRKRHVFHGGWQRSAAAHPTRP
ncbi:hypothetical protein CIP107521_00932 [Corynebacterium diphtheriae]|nr:hypothetical protein CIP107521_00932 [Corynebacterium diphtheriae]